MSNQLLDTDFINNYKDGKSLNDILLYSYETNSVEYIKRGYELFKANAGSFIGFLFLAFFIRIFAGLIPIVGNFITIPLMSGVYVVAKKTSQNEDTQFGDFFEGYKKFVSIVGATIIQVLIIIVLILIAVVPFILSNGLDSLDSLDYSSLGGSELTFVIIILTLVFLMLVIYVMWLFSNLLILFNDSDAWQSLEISRKVISKKFFNWVGFILLLYVLNIAGAMCFFVGLLITIPTTFCAIYAAYEDIVGLNLRD